MRFFHQRAQVGGERKNMWLGASWVATCLCAILTIGSAQAAPLGLTLADFPDITSAFIAVTYDASEEKFEEHGFAFSLATGPGSSETIVGGTIDVTATIDNFGVLQSGTLTIEGAIPTLSSIPIPSWTTLLTGDLTAFGFDGSNDPFEFLFIVTGGALQSIFTPVSGQILTSTGFGGTFTADFDNLLFGIGTGSNDSASALTGTPEPSTILLFITGLGILGGCLAWRQRARA